MKKLLLLMICVPPALMAQNGVEISTVQVSAGSPATVTFNVSWDKTAMPSPLWSDTVWVFVDYNSAGAMTRLPLSAGATLTASSAPAGVGRVMSVPGNNRGVWVIGNARSAGSFSATVRLLTSQSGVVGACAYASNYPPVGTFVSASHISFMGTPPYSVTLRSDIGTASRTEGNSFVVPAGYAVQSFTDKTEAPGILVPATYTLSGAGNCAVPGVTLTLQGSHYGWRYQLYRDGVAVGAAVDGTGSTLTFTDTPGIDAYDYAVQTLANAAMAQRALPASDVLTVTMNCTPPGAASTQTWTAGTQIWSDALQKAQTGCIEVTHMGPNDAPEPPGPYYRASDLYSGSGYLYNWRCVNEYGAQLCPSPWRVPSRNDFQTLDGILGGNGSTHTETPEWVTDNYVTRWGGVYGGSSFLNSIDKPGTTAWYWSSSLTSSGGTLIAHILFFDSTGRVYSDSYGNQIYGNQVRCVK
jgi:uncharacterized protein (TIGR02145 family)